MVTAWASDQHLVLAQIATDEKSNEIIAVPKLLRMLSLEGMIVTADALNCQRETSKQIVEQGGDYVLALKENQPTLYSDVAVFLDDPETEIQDISTTVDGDHGRIEARTAIVSTDIEWLKEDHKWPGLEAIGKIIRVRETPKGTTTETAYYILSRALSAERFGAVARSEWGIENGLHWVLEVVMNEDYLRNRKDNGPYNLAVLRHLALNVIQMDKSKGSKRVKSKRAGWDDRFLASLLMQFRTT